MDVLDCWGKTDRDGSFHPAVYHMIDVGHVAATLLAPESTTRIGAALSRALSGADASTLLDWLPLAVALHDLGKISPDFQGMVPEQKARLVAAGCPFPGQPATARHQHISAIVFQDEVLPRLPWLRPVAIPLIDMLAGHHGTFVGAQTHLDTRNLLIWTSNTVWPALRSDALDILLAAFPVSTDPAINPPNNLRVATAALTGFAILSDWIGSDSNHFPPSVGVPLDAYLPLSRSRAAAAVAAVGFDRVRQPVIWSGFSTAFPDISSPRPLQTAIDDLDPAIFATPSLVIVEAPTGEGKTEAAIALARRFAVGGASDELYVALPTTATSNQMFRRVLRFLDGASTGPTPVKLVHGQALLTEDAIVADAFGDRRDPDSPAYALPVWFSSRKRSLLAPFGVGTVDQTELAVLSARHYMLRMLGLAGKTVIIDEVHAYDTYMSTIIDHALTWLAALGSPVILLSATLPAARHRQLAAAYCAGLGSTLPERVDAHAAHPPYPLLAIYPGPAGTAIAISPPAAHSDRSLAVEIVPDLPADQDARRLLALNAGGGAVCRITNTVRRAQQIFAALQQLAPADVELHLLHARIPGDDRLARETLLANRLGPASRRSPSERIIVVGTQILEQSLDYDVDVMITDHAPIDLLLQRAGRLHRHHRQRPAGFEQTVLQVSLSFDGDGRPRFTDAALIYEPWLLWTTWLTLSALRDAAGRIGLTLPADYRSLIERSYAVEPATAASGPFAEAIAKAHADFVQKQHGLAGAAALRLIPDPTPGLAISEGRNLSFEEDEDGGQSGWGFAATRDGLPSITVVPLVAVAGGAAIQAGESPLAPGTCDHDMQLRLLRRAMRVQHPRIVATLLASVPQSLTWLRELPLLRHHVPLLLDADLRANPGVPVRLDPVLGLVIGEESVT